MELAGKVVVVTGASSGIGKATARAMARMHSRVVLIARDGDRLRHVVEAIEAEGGKASAYTADLSDMTAIDRAAAAIRDHVGIPDVVVNNAGAGQWKSLIDTDPDEARGMVEVPYLAAFAVTRVFLPDMLRRGAGRVVAVTSPASYLSWPDACGYIAARHALKGFAEGLRADLQGTGVGVSLVVLGTVKSSYWDHNPGSRERVPRSIPLIMPDLTTEQAAAAVVRAVARNRARLVRPVAF